MFTQAHTYVETQLSYIFHLVGGSMHIFLARLSLMNNLFLAWPFQCRLGVISWLPDDHSTCNSSVLVYTCAVNTYCATWQVFIHILFKLVFASFGFLLHCKVLYSWFDTHWTKFYYMFLESNSKCIQALLRMELMCCSFRLLTNRCLQMVSCSDAAGALERHGSHCHFVTDLSESFVCICVSVHMGMCVCVWCVVHVCVSDSCGAEGTVPRGNNWWQVHIFPLNLCQTPQGCTDILENEKCFYKYRFPLWPNSPPTQPLQLYFHLVFPRTVSEEEVASFDLECPITACPRGSQLLIV